MNVVLLMYMYISCCRSVRCEIIGYRRRVWVEVVIVIKEYQSIIDISKVENEWVPVTCLDVGDCFYAVTYECDLVIKCDDARENDVGVFMCVFVKVEDMF